MTAQCLLCEPPVNREPSDHRWIVQTGRWAVRSHPALQVPGWLAVHTSRHVESLADLDHSEASSFGQVISAVTAALQGATGKDRIYTYSLGESIRHVHMLVGPTGVPTDPEGRGGAYLARILRRDQSLEDPTAVQQILKAVTTSIAYLEATP
jgi:diadenosine tetraphosphate (Ap4A) HIT family hydrolase